MATPPSRRQFLLGAGGALGAAAATGTVGVVLSRRAEVSEETASPVQRVPAPGRDPAAVRDAVTTTEWIFSPARRRKVRLVTVLPAADLRPLVISAHARGYRFPTSDPLVCAPPHRT